MRADQWLMLGVVGLGAGAAYLLTRTPKNQDPSAQGRAPTDDGRRSTDVLGDRPQAIAAPAGVFFVGSTPKVSTDPNLSAPSLALENSRAYRLRGEGLSEDDLPFLDAVRVYTAIADARLAGFPEWSLAGATAQTRWAYGRYLYPSASVPRPQHLQAMWITTRAPATTIGRRSSGVGNRGSAIAPPYLRPSYGARLQPTLGPIATRLPAVVPPLPFYGITRLATPFWPAYLGRRGPFVA